jgi:hypothetical protein
MNDVIFFGENIRRIKWMERSCWKRSVMSKVENGARLYDLSAQKLSSHDQLFSSFEKIQEGDSGRIGHLGITGCFRNKSEITE